jgi:hypothetical protein
VLYLHRFALLGDKREEPKIEAALAYVEEAFQS